MADPITILAVTSLLAGGFMGKQAADAEAESQQIQAGIAQDEATREAGRVAVERRKFLKRQKLAFLKNGVTLEGSPLLVLQETEEESQKEVDALVRRGSALGFLGRSRARITRRKGRAALVRGFGGAASTASRAGAFDSSGDGGSSPFSTGSVGRLARRA